MDSGSRIGIHRYFRPKMLLSILDLCSGGQPHEMGQQSTERSIETDFILRVGCKADSTLKMEIGNSCTWSVLCLNVSKFLMGQIIIGTEIGVFEVVSKTFCQSAFHQLFVLRRAAGGMYFGYCSKLPKPA